MSAPVMLSLQSVARQFGGLQVLSDLNLNVPPGGIFGLIGPNGAGKTTVFNLVTGLLAPTRGEILFDGHSLVGRLPHQITRLGIARTFQNIRIFKEMTLLEDVVVGSHARLLYGPADWLFGLPKFHHEEWQARERARELLTWMKLEHKAHELADKLSYGEQRKLELARALATEPRLLLLDEPVAGMNSAEKAELMRSIVDIRERGYTVLLIEHDMPFVMGLCDEIAVLNFGRIIAQGRPEQIRADPQVIEAYLGRDDDDEACTDAGVAQSTESAP